MDALGRTAPYRWMGSIPLETPFTLAALSGYSDLGMRTVCRQLGACLTRHEVVLDQFILDNGSGPKSGHHLDPTDRPIACQLMGADPEMMGEAAGRMVTFGYDMVDINFGCPVKKVLGRCRGGFLLRDPSTAIAMMKSVMDNVRPVPVTVKMRRAADETPAARDNFWRILDAGVELGIVGVAVHGRTVEQRYEGFADWDIMAEVKQRYPDLIVFGSGDLFTAEDCMAMLARTGIDGVTIARGAIQNPWIFRECLALWEGRPKPAPPTIAEQSDLLDRQYKLAVQQYGPERASRQMRKFGIKYSQLHHRGEEVRSAFVSLSCPADWDHVRNTYYREEPQLA